MDRRVITSAALGHFTTHALELTFAALLLSIGREFDVSLVALGAVANAGTLTFGMTALPSGWVTDRFGPRAVIVFAMVSSAVFALGVAAAPNMAVLAVALALLGAAIGLYHPPGTAMVSAVIERRGRAFAIHGIAGNLGISAAPAIATSVAVFGSWRAAYVVLALVALAVAWFVWRNGPDRDEARERVELAVRAMQRAPGGKAQRRTSPPHQRSWFARPLLLIYVATIGTGFVYRGALTFLPAHLEEHLGLSIFGWSPEAVAGAMSSIVLLTAVLGQIWGGMLSDRWPLERAALPIVVLLVPMLLLVGGSGGVPLLFAAAGFGLVNFAQQPVFNGLIADYSPAGAAGRAFGISFFLSFGLGSFAASFAGLVADRWGTGPTFTMLAGVAVGLSVLTGLVLVGAMRRRAHLDALERGTVAEAVAGG
jgi:MFS family permease